MRFAARLFILAAAAALPVSANAETVSLSSPNGRIVATVSDEGGLNYAVTKNGSPLIRRSSLGLKLDRGGSLGPTAKIASTQRASVNRQVTLRTKASRVADRYNEARFDLEDASSFPRRMQLIVRAYDDGVALRYILPAQQALDAVNIEGDDMQFNFAADYRCWGTNLGRFGTSHEAEYDPTPASRIRNHHQYDLPLVCETGQLGAFAIAEADVRDYPASYLRGNGDGRFGVQTWLSPRLDNQYVAATTRIGSDVVAPWRILMIADHAGKLIESNHVELLSPEPAAGDWSWVRPGKTSWDWWNGPWLASGTKPTMETATLKRFIDFSAANGFEYAMIDEGWYAGAGGGGDVRPGVDVTRPGRDVDLPELVRYAKAKGVGLWLWVNWKALESQMDDALPLYQRWGIKGIKVDFMDRDDQAMVQWYHRLLRKAGEHRLMVDLHGAFHPVGLNRTYPHYLTQEGVLGAEYNKWSGRITATHNVTLPYTRMLVGPMDYTPGGFVNATPSEFQPRMLNPMVKTTRGQALAMYVVYESALQIVADSPDVYAASPAGLDFIRAVPTTWDETRFLAGEVGEYVVLARRKGSDWYIGAMTNETARNVQVPLDLLGAGNYRATIYEDGAGPKDLNISSRTLDRSGRIDLRLAGSGGAAVILRGGGRSRR